MSDRVPATFDDVRALRHDFVEFAEGLRAELRAEAARERAIRDLEAKRLEQVIASALNGDREWKGSVKSQLLKQNAHFERLGLADHAGPVAVFVEPSRLGIRVSTWRMAFVALLVVVIFCPLVACAGIGVARVVSDAGSPAREVQR